VAALMVTSSRVSAQTPPPLTFLGFAAGDSLSAVTRQLKSSGGSALKCREARRDASVNECRGRLADSISGRKVELWLAAIDSASGILTLSGRMAPAAADQWRDTLVAHYGLVPVRVQGSQSMMQWVRRGRMLRLTWRVEGETTIASVSLVDGWVLDGWGARRRPAPPS
jgi:hypothetical protein